MEKKKENNSRNFSEFNYMKDTADKVKVKDKVTSVLKLLVQSNG